MIPDLISFPMRVLLILESPHRDELEGALPANGKTGRAISRVILGREDVSFSQLVRHPSVSASLNCRDVTHIGIMNISTFPLQRASYTEQFKEIVPSNIAVFERVKNDLEKEKRTKKKEFMDPDMERAQKSIYGDFKRRLGYCVARSESLTLVPCGHFARYFVGWFLAQNQGFTSAVKVIEDVPHPAARNGGWSSLDPVIRSTLAHL